MGYIYKITNDVNGKMYVGKTELVDPFKRWKEHLHDYKTRRCEKRPLYAAMNKYGEDHFSFKVIEETNSLDETCKREQYWINKLRTYVGFEDCNGYNATLGGDGKAYLNLNEDEVREYHVYEANCLASDTAKHFNVSKDTIKHFLKKHNIPYLKNADIIRLHTYIEYGGVYKINPKSKIIEDIFENTVDADNYLNVKNKISRACKGKKIINHYMFNYLWFYGKDYLEHLEEIKEFNINKYKISKKDNKKNLNLKRQNKKCDFNMIYESLLATRNLIKTIYELNLNLKSESYIRRKLKQLGYDLSILHKTATYIMQRDKYTKEIINIFHSIREANIHLGKPVDSRNISSCLQGKTKTAYGFIWEYLN